MIRLYVSTFGKPANWIRSATPIEVGAANRNLQKETGILYDDTGDSISQENAYFGELTGLYWIWKNIRFDEKDIIGFCHYNKCLDRNNTESSEIHKSFARHSGPYWIVREPEVMVPHDYPEDIQRMREILETEETGYLQAWDILYDGKGASREGKANCYAGQMFYADQQSFHDYCDFLFRVLFQLRNAVGDCTGTEERPAFHKRYCAFLGERLLSVFLLKNNREYETREVQYNESILLRAARKARKVLSPIRKNHAEPTLLGKRLMQSHQSSYREQPEESGKTE